jgi:hypothetical protein
LGSAPAREDRTDYFVLQGADLAAVLEEWISCLGGGGEVGDINTEAGAGFGRFVDGGFVAAEEWAVFESSDPAGAQLLKVPGNLDTDMLWVLMIEWTIVDENTCPSA